MGPTIAELVIGVLLTVAFGAFGTAFVWLRSDVISRLDKMDDKWDARFERLEAKVDGLIMTLASTGHLTDPDDSGADD